MKKHSKQILIGLAVLTVAYYLWKKKAAPATGAKVLFEGDVDGKGRVLSIPDQKLAEAKARAEYVAKQAAGDILSPSYNPLA